MPQWYVELRTPSSGDTLSWDIVRHLYARQVALPVVIIVESPATFLPALRKQWIKLTRAVQSERARTLDASLILALTRSMAHMRQLQFTVHSLGEQPGSDVFLVDPVSPGEIPVGCRTLYITCPLPNSALSAVCKQLPRRSLVVTYDQSTATALEML